MWYGVNCIVRISLPVVTATMRQRITLCNVTNRMILMSKTRQGIAKIEYPYLFKKFMPHVFGLESFQNVKKGTKQRNDSRIVFSQRRLFPISFSVARYSYHSCTQSVGRYLPFGNNPPNIRTYSTQNLKTCAFRVISRSLWVIYMHKFGTH